MATTHSEYASESSQPDLMGIHEEVEKRAEQRFDQSELIPKQEQVREAIAAIQSRFRWIRVQVLVQQLYSRIIIQRDPTLHSPTPAPSRLSPQPSQVSPQPSQVSPQPSQVSPQPSQVSPQLSSQVQRWVAQSFIQLGYGYANFKKYLRHHSIFHYIAQPTYQRTLDQQLLRTQHHLQKIIKPQYPFQLQDATHESQLNSQEQSSSSNDGLVLSVLKQARDELPAVQRQHLFAVMRANSKYPTVDQHSAARLHSSIQKLMGQFANQHTSDQSFSQEQYEPGRYQGRDWSREMSHELMRLYAGGHPIASISLLLRQKYHNEQLNDFAIQSQLKVLLKVALESLRHQQQQPECIAQGNRFKRLVKLDHSKTQMILTLPEATEVRTMLAHFYLLHTFDLNALVCTILSVNEFVNRKENEAIQRSLMRAKANNSISREEYAFEGKRRKVLVLKRQKKGKTAET